MERSRKILLTHAYLLRFDPKQWKQQQAYAPLATLYAAAALRARGEDVSVFDMQLATGPEAIEEVLDRLQPRYFVIYDDGFNYLTKMCLTNMRAAAQEMIRRAKAKNCSIIVSGSDVTDHPEYYLDAGADFVLAGEGEQTICELIDALNNDTDIANVPGLICKREGNLVRTTPRPVLRDLDTLPLPAWDLIDLEPYKKMWLKSAGYFSVNISTTRGCPFKCNWCAKPIYGNRYHARSPQSVVDEIKLLRAQMEFDHIWFCDDIFGLKKGWVEEFARLVRGEGLSFRFRIQSRADLLLQEDYVAALADAGCEQVWMGAESGSQKILDAMDKGITVGQIQEATQLLKAHGIHPCFFIQFGYPGETLDDIRSTIRLINRMQPREIGISISYPLPGTVFHERVKEQLEQKANWTDSDEMALMFRNTYPPRFYKQLHHYVHQNYRRHMALKQWARWIRKPWQMDRAALRKMLSGIYLLPAVWIAGIRLHQSRQST